MTGQPVRLPDAAARLADLETQVRYQIRDTRYETPPWQRRDPSGVYPVVIVGAGQAGLAAAFGLRRKGIEDVIVLESAAEGKAGPWPTYARMRTLRTSKHSRWPAWDVPAATPRLWFCAVYGEMAWDDIEFFPTDDWFAFLEWYRRIIDIDVRFGKSVCSMTAATGGRGVELTTTDAAGVTETIVARRVILATGIEGAGGPRVPDMIAQLPSDLWNHTHDDIDFAALRGKRIGVLGAGTSAFDNAALALESGARTVTVHMRRDRMPMVSPYRWMEFPPIIEQYAALSDDQKWEFNQHLTFVDQPATQQAIWRAYAHPGFSVRYESPWEAVGLDGDQIVVTTKSGTHIYDFVIAATGVAVDLARRREFAAFVDDIMLWADRDAPVRDPRYAELLEYPYLGNGYALKSKSGANDDLCGRVYMFNHGARMSAGVLCHQVSGLVGGLPRLVDDVVADIVSEFGSALIEEFLRYDESAGVVDGPRITQQHNIIKSEYLSGI
ncbi:MAG: NAD(P)-binding domain-containing protein [Gordonia sp. (in: high G+C Gram-positive bacteria)]